MKVKNFIKKYYILVSEGDRPCPWGARVVKYIIKKDLYYKY